MYDIEPITTPKSTACGPACLAMVLKYYGEETSIDALINERPATVAGWTGKDVLHVGRAHGLEMVAYQMDAEELIRQDRPAIVWWLYSHYVLFAGKDEQGQVVICNPGRGRYRVSADVFKSFYSGVSFWNGEPQPLPDEPPADYGERIAALEDELAAAKIILGVE